MRISEERYSRDLRQFNLAVRLTQHRVRTGQIKRWTGLSARRVRHLQSQALGMELKDPAVRPRGGSPRDLLPLMHTSSQRSEASVFVLLCGVFDVWPTARGVVAAQQLPSVARGERICAAYETYRELVPHPTLSLEQALLLVTSVVRGTDIDIVKCKHCTATVLLHRLRPDRCLCASCTQSAVGKQPSDPPDSPPPLPGLHDALTQAQGSLF